MLAERYSTVLGMETEYVPNFIEKLPDLMELIEPKEMCIRDSLHTGRSAEPPVFVSIGTEQGDLGPSGDVQPQTFPEKGG